MSSPQNGCLPHQDRVVYSYWFAVPPAKANHLKIRRLRREGPRLSPQSQWNWTMPKRILLIGLLFCLGGIGAIWDVFADLFVSRINVNFAVLLLPVGVGLLRGNRSSQWWARFWIILGYFLCGLLLVLALVSPGAAYATWFQREIRGPEAVPYVIMLGILFLVLLAAMHALLYSEKASSYFEKKSERGAAPNGGFAAPLESSGALEGPPSVNDRSAVMKRRSFRALLLATVFLVGAGLLWISSRSARSLRPTWRFWQYSSQGQVPKEWTTTETWQSPRYNRDVQSDCQNYLLHVVARSKSDLLAELKLRIQFAVQVEGYPVAITVSDKTIHDDGVYALSSIAEWDEIVSSFQIGVVSTPEKSRHYVTWPADSRRGSSSSIGGTGIGLCPMVKFSLSSMFADGEHAQFARTAFLDVQDVRALLVAEKDTPRGMFPGGEQPVSWTIELIPDDGDLPLQRFVIPEGETEP